jgi:hypothetical protein
MMDKHYVDFENGIQLAAHQATLAIPFGTEGKRRDRHSHKNDFLSPDDQRSLLCLLSSREANLPQLPILSRRK